MKKSLYFSLILVFVSLFLSFDSCYAQDNSEKLINELYSLEFNIDKINNQHFFLDILFEPKNGSFITSPYALDMSGHFRITFDKNNFIQQDNEISENPASVFDQFWWAENPVKIVRVKTNFRQQLTVTSYDNFEVSGVINFVIEPKCTMEEIGFTISVQDGNMNVILIE